MTTAQAGTRLKSDASTVLKFIKRGVRVRGQRKRVRLDATRDGWAWSITADAVRAFAAARRHG